MLASGCFTIIILFLNSHDGVLYAVLVDWLTLLNSTRHGRLFASHLLETRSRFWLQSIARSLLMDLIVLKPAGTSFRLCTSRRLADDSDSKVRVPAGSIISENAASLRLIGPRYPAGQAMESSALCLVS